MSLKVSRILHAGYIFECGQTKIAFDPIFENPFSVNCYAFPGVEFVVEQIRSMKFDAVFISHFHEDHCSLTSLDLLDRATPVYIYCLSDRVPDAIRALGFRVVQLRLGESIRIGEFEVLPLRALDAEIDCVFHLSAGGLNVLNVVDAWLDLGTLNRLARESAWDLVLWPFQTMREVEVLAPLRISLNEAENSRRLPPEWLEQLQILKPRFVVPGSCQFMHESWSWYNHALFPISYASFARELGAILPDTQIVRLDPGVAVTLTRDSLATTEPLEWIRAIGEQDVDYDYRPDAAPTPTREIAKHFPALTDDEMRVVVDFCRDGLVTELNAISEGQQAGSPEQAAMAQDNDIYFGKPRLWRLSVYDHAGAETSFHYFLKNGAAQLVRASVVTLGWTTEISATKLFAAIARGESLTSLYLRINDTVFTPEIEKEIASADVLCDPLIRVLSARASN